MEINRKNARVWSRLGPRATYGITMLELVERNDKVYALSADLGGSSGLQRLMDLYPDRYLNTGIAEQNLIGVCAGLAREGLVPFASSFAPFITHRCADQVRMNMGYMHLNIKTVGLGSGVSMSVLGNSHYGLDDLSFMRSIPDMTILCPCDCAELVKCIEAAAEYEGPVYIRMTGEPGMPRVYEEEFDFTIGKANILKRGEDICVIAAGSTVICAVEAAEKLREQGINASVIDMHTVKPLDTEVLDRLAAYNYLITVEEHSVIGGLGSAVAEYMAPKKRKPRQLFIGIEDCFPHAGDYKHMLRQCGLTAEQIVEKVLKFTEGRSTL